MPFGQPIEIPTEKLECGCVVMGRTDEGKEVVSHCRAHWGELSDEERTRITRERRASLLDGLYGLALRLAMVALVIFMIWMVFRRVGG